VNLFSPAGIPFAVVVAVGLAVPAPARSQATCARGAARTFTVGATIALSAAPPRCRIEYKPTSIDLRTDAANGVAAFRPSVVRSPDGRMFTHAGFGAVDVWSREGRYVRTVGRQGNGPGEFSGGSLDIHFDSSGRMYVRDNGARWSVFSPSLEFVRTTGAYGMGSERNRAAFISDNVFLATGGAAADMNGLFHLYDFRSEAPVAPSRHPDAVRIAGPTHLRSFGTPRTGERDVPMSARTRAIAYRGGGKFWAGPPEGAGRGFELELWDTAGTRLLTLRHSLEWLAAPQQTRSGRVLTQLPPPPEFEILSIDDSDLLYVMVAGANTRWRPIDETLSIAARRKAQAGMFGVSVHIIDVRSATILASTGPLSPVEAQRVLPVGMFNGARVGYRILEADSGFQWVQLVEYVLLAR
jgi:hypothetical protein